jgi:hypothetical protein
VWRLSSVSASPTWGKFGCERLHSRTLRLRALVLVSLVPLSGCHSGSPRLPPGIPPTSISREEPGGNAADPHESALQRLRTEPWGWRNDKQDALHVPLPDWQNWRRIRYYGVTSFVGFRYGDDHHAVIAIWVRETDEGTTADECLEKFEKWASPTAHSFSVQVGPGTVTHVPWTPKPEESPHGELTVAVKSLQAEVNTLLSRKSYAAAYAAYVMWPKTCTIFGVAVPERDSEELAREVRDRYVNDGFWRLERRSELAPAF